MNDVELTFLPGLREFVTDEVARIPGLRNVAPVPGRDDAVRCRLAGSLRPLLALRTVVAPFLALHFAVPRPRSLLSGEYLPRIVGAMESARRLDGAANFRIEAAGRDSSVFRRLAAALSEGAALPFEPDDGECVLRFRRSADGWDVLVRLTRRPLSAREWRVQGHPAALNATIAAAAGLLAGLDANDRVANLMCGSGTLLIERLLMCGSCAAVGVDSDPAAIAACRANVDAAGLAGRVELLTADIAGDAWVGNAPFDVLLADPPWGDKAGRHADSEAVHMSMLERARAAAGERARFVVVTHEIRVMERCLRRGAGRWQLADERRVFAKGHHPRLYLLHGSH